MRWLANIVIKLLNLKDNTPFGWLSVLKIYTFKDFKHDSVFPCILSVLMIIGGYFTDIETYVILGKVLDIGLIIIPVLISLLIAAYAILLSVFCSAIFRNPKKTEEGKALLEKLNSNFGISILVSIIAIFFLICISYIHSLHLSFIYFNLLNIIVLLIIFYLLFFSVWILKDIVISIFDIGQVAIHFSDENESKEELTQMDKFNAYLVTGQIDKAKDVLTDMILSEKEWEQVANFSCDEWRENARKALTAKYQRMFDAVGIKPNFDELDKMK